jgi:hypothetical protein
MAARTASAASAATAGGPRLSAVSTVRSTAQAIRLIESAREPGDLFGAADARRVYRRLAQLTHPDACPGDARAAAAFAKLARLWQQHQTRIGPGILAARGDLANLYQTSRGLLKIARDPADNDLIDREARALAQLRRAAEPRFAPYFPELVEIRRVHDPRTGAERRGNVITRLAGFGSLAEVRAAFPGGVDPRDAAWMWRRLLAALGAAHRAGVVHGAVLDEHVMIQPDEHGVVLVDWCYSAPPGSPLTAVVARHRDRYPAEILARGPAGPDTDIWLATACMTGLVGGLMPAPMAAFARGCMLASPRRRPDDAWALLAEFDELLGRLYGPRKFRPFAIPA